MEFRGLDGERAEDHGIRRERLEMVFPSSFFCFFFVVIFPSFPECWEGIAGVDGGRIGKKMV
jgi:hypothetical protein